jgi:hypothetical protein
MFRSKLRIKQKKSIESNLVQKEAIRLPKIHLQRFKESIDYSMYAKLKFRRRASWICQLNVEISIQVSNFLKKKFNLTSRFQQKEEIIKQFDLIVERIVSENTTIKVDENFFMAKVYKKRDELHNQKKIKGPIFLTLKFRKQEIISQ